MLGDFEAAVSASISEAAFTTHVIDLAQWLDWKVAHFRPARVTVRGRESFRTAVQGDGVGFPDLLLIRGPRLVAAELKSERGRLTREQAAWLEAFAGAGIETHIWRPAQLEELVEVLR
jgi:hypothetical protein